MLNSFLYSILFLINCVYCFIFEERKYVSPFMFIKIIKPSTSRISVTDTQACIHRIHNRNKEIRKCHVMRSGITYQRWPFLLVKDKTVFSKSRIQEIIINGLTTVGQCYMLSVSETQFNSTLSMFYLKCIPSSSSCGPAPEHIFY